MYAVRYYSRNDQVDPTLLSQDNRRAQVLILADTAESLLPKTFPTLHLIYPVQRERLRGVSVLTTPMAVNPAPAAVP
jgi:hypothetical protein